MSQESNAVLVQGAIKYYGRRTKILDDLFMRVPRGSIYGLLGASGCGKTTLLSCIVGRRKLNSGEILVFGKIPGSKGSGIPGPRIGYMPQDIALVGELTVKDCAFHFGWIYGMTNKQLEARYSFLEQLLELPPPQRYVKDLSGGQKRRVSLAVALIHDAELLIMDEPTVGLDPILRQNIWDFLVTLTTEHHKTVIITTHYIEEARQAHVIGLMRNGKLLCEGSPAYLMSKLNAPSLEQVFFLLSEEQETKLDPALIDNNRNIELSVTSSRQNQPVTVPTHELKKSSSFLHHDNVSLMNSTFKTRQKALLVKNLLRIVRNPGGMCFSFILPILEIIMFFMTVGGDPHDLRIGIVNKELGNYSNCDQYRNHIETGTVYENSVCSFQGLGCHFLLRLHNDLSIKYQYRYFEELDEAMETARHGHIAGVMYIAENFTESIEARRWLGRDVDDSSLLTSEVQIWLDMTNSQTGKLMEKQIYEAYFQFSKQLLRECDEDVKLAGIPVSFQVPVYGSYTATYATFIAPGVIVTLIFFLAVSVTSIIIITERDDGVWDRTLASGVTTTEILVSHTMTQGLVMSIQTFELMIVSFGLFGLDNKGDYLTLVLLFLVQGLCGMCAGFSISIFCDTIVTSNFVSMGSFVPIVVLSGTLWPLEGMPTLLKWFSLCLPTTLATQATRNIIEKGWTFFELPVLAGYLATVSWIIALSIASAFILKVKN